MSNEKPTLLFDWGGVLAPDDSIDSASQLSEKYGIPHDAIHSLLANESDSSVDDNDEPFFYRIQQQFDIPREEIAELKNNGEPNSTYEYCFELQAQGYQLYLLSDQMQFRTAHIKENFDLSCFEQTFFSSDIGFTKEQPESFLTVIEQTGLDPVNTIFIDDRAENIEIAEQVGFTGIQYVSLKDLQLQLHT